MDKEIIKGMSKINPFNHKLAKHPAYQQKLTFGQRAADKLAVIAGSWGFILAFGVFLVIWIAINGYFLLAYEFGTPFDPYPFILLNLALSCLAAIQAPVILMSQNRQAQRDRLTAQYDYAVNRRAEREIQEIKKEISFIRRRLQNKIN